MDATWRDLLVLLRGKSCVGVACEAIGDLAEQNIEVLPDLFHEVVFDLLVSNVTHVRNNGSTLLRILCAQFSLVLTPLLSDSCTDGVLFTIDDINIPKVLRCSGGQLRSSTTAGDVPSTVYTTSWLNMQVSELRTRIGLESNSSEVVDAAQYDNLEELLRPVDVSAHEERGAAERECSPHLKEIDESFPCNLNLHNVKATSETWFARLVRVMIVGLLSPTWEIRHGYALGLTVTLESLYPDLMHGQKEQQERRLAKLPAFLCDDMLCCGLCVLLLDRFMDFGCSEQEGSSVSPVKEAAGSMVACALQCADDLRRKRKAWELLVEMTTSSGVHWTVTLGGLIALKNFVRNNSLLVLVDQPELFASLVLRGVGSAAAGQEEVACCACEVLEALARACETLDWDWPDSSSNDSNSNNSSDNNFSTSSKSISICGQQQQQQQQHSVLCLLSALTVGIDEVATAAVGTVGSSSHAAEWEAPACLLLKLCVAVRSICRLVQSLWSRQVVSVNLEENTITVEVEVVLRLLVVQQKLVTMLFAYQERVRRRCLQMCLQSLQVLGTLLGTSGMRSCLTACPATAVLQVRVALFSLLGSLLCASCMASQFPCTDLQLEDSSGSGSGTGAGVGAGKSRGITRASQEEGGWSADLDGGSEASAVLLLCSAHHDHATMWKSLAEVCLEISHATSLSSSLELKRTTIAIQEVIEYTLRSSSSYSTTAGVNPTMSPLDGAEEYKSAITSFHAMLRSFLVREKERFACSAGSKGFSLLYAPKDCASVWDIATTARRGNLVTMLAALAVGSGHDCVDGLLRSVDTVVASEAVTNPAVVPRSVHPLSRIVGGGQQAVTAPKKRKFVIVSDVCEGPAASKRATVPIATPSAVPRATSSSSSLIPTPTSYSHIPPPDQQPQACSRSELLASLTLLVIDIQLQLQQHLALALAGGVKVPVAAASERVAGMRSSLQGALALCTCPGGELPQHPSAEVARALLAGDICSAMLVVSCGAFAASAAEDARVCLAAAAARVLLCSFAEDTNSGPERFRRLLTDLVAPTISGLVSSSFVNAMLFALLKISGEHIIQMFSVVLDCISSDRSPQSIWCLASALSACNRQVRRELVKKFDLLGVVFSSISQLSRASTVGESVSGAVEVLCLMTDPIDICATTYNNTGAAGTSVLAEGHAPTEYSEVDGHAISELLNIGTQLHRFLSRDSVQPLLLLPAESPPLARRNAAEVLHRLVLRRLEVVVHCYEVWFAAALQGIGDSDPCVRRCCVRAFRSLVPLASVAKRVSARRHLSEQPGASFASDDLIDHIFTKQSALKIQLSDQQRDQQIMAVLAAKTNLWVSSSSSLGSAALHLHPAQLRAYQWDGVSWLTQLRRFGLNGILADEMGLGKSLQALTALAIQRIEANFMTEPSLIVCPATLVLHWEDEIAHYFPSDLLRAVKYSSLTGSGATAGGGGGGVVLEGRDVVIASYEMVRRDVIKASGNGGTSLLSGRLWETVIADEAHLIKNPAAGTTKAVCSLQSKHRMALSGTPLQNQVEELWSLMNFVLPDYIGDYQTFRCDTVLPIQRSFSARRELKRSAGLLRATFEDASAPAGRKQRDSSLAKFHQAIEVSAVGLGLLRTLHKQVLPFILRRTKEMVAKDLPSKTIVDVLCPLSAQQAQLYDAHLRHLDLTDEQMEQELRLVEAEREADSSPISLSEPPDEIIDYEALKTAVAPVSSSNAAGPALALGGWGAVSSKIGLMMPALEDSAPPPPVRPRRNALESLNYLKLLGVHPALVVADGSYKARLLKSHTSSGKLLKLANLLLESGVMAREDFSPHRSLAELEGGNHSLLKGSADCCEGDGRCIDDEEEKEESGEAVQEMCVDGLEVEQGEPSKKPTAKNGKGKEKTTKEGKGSTKKKTKKSEEEHAKANSSERIVASATADHACRSAHNNADLLPPTHRCLIFAQHRAALDLVEEHVLQRYFPEVGYQRLDGSVDAAKRAAIARKFNSQERRSETVAGVLPLRSEQEDEAARTAQVQLLKGKLPAAALQRAPVGTTDSSVDKSSSVTGDSTGDIRVLLLTTRACGLGLNLTAADTVIFLEHDWNPFADLQAMDRVHRLGQTHPVTVYRLLAESTVEARIMRLQGLKRNIVDQVINEDNAGDRGGNGGDEGGAASGSSSGGAGGGSNGHGGGSSKQFGAVLMESLLHV